MIEIDGDIIRQIKDSQNAHNALQLVAIAAQSGAAGGDGHV